MKKKVDLWVHQSPTLKKLIIELKITFLIVVTGISNAVATPTYYQVPKVSLDMENSTNVSYAVLDRKILLTTHALLNNWIKDDLQQKQITGVITDSQTGEGMPGVNVVVKGTNIGTMTDVNGRFSINVSDGKATLVLSFIGYISQEIPVMDRVVINVALVSDLKQLEEVVVIGYGTMKKSSVTGSIAKVENKILDQVPTSSVLKSLQGRLSGVHVINNNEQPGQSPSIIIRGRGSISGGNNPLIVIDGFPGGSLEQVSMNDIESIEVLKDASAAAIYGSRGSGGVVIVTTKKGNAGAPQLTFNSYAGFSIPHIYDDWATAEEWVYYQEKIMDRWFANDGYDPSIPHFGDPARPLAYQVNPALGEIPHTIWQKEVTQIAPIQNYNLSAKGGTNDIKYYLSATINNEDGTIKTEYYKSYSLRANVDVRINKTLQLSALLNPSYNDRRLSGQSMHDLARFPSFVPPTQNADGTWPNGRDYWSPSTMSSANPYDRLYNTENFQNEFRNLGELSLNMNLLKGLNLRSSLGSNLSYTQQDNWSGVQRINYNGSARDSRGINLVNENILNYNGTFKDAHEINVLAGASYQKSTSRSNAVVAVANSFANDIIHTLNNAQAHPTSSTSSKSQWGLVSYFGRINYAYKEKYLLSASYRLDGSSRFGKNKKWGEFPSLSAAWRINKESFMSEIPAISELRLRASYGVTGNFNIGNFAWLGTMGNSYYVPDYVLTTGMVQTSFENNNLSWEKTHSYDYGFNLGLFDNRLSFSLDYYIKRTTNLLYNISIPAATGFTSALSNIGEIENKGFEIELSTRNLKGQFQWNTIFNLARNKNQVVDLGGIPERISETEMMWFLLKPGVPMASYYGYKIVGIFMNQGDIDHYPKLPTNKPGDPIFQDTNNDGVITPADRVILGNYFPDLTIGLINDFSWKRFDMNIVIQSSLGGENYDFNQHYSMGRDNGSIRTSVVKNQFYSVDDPGDGKTPSLCRTRYTIYNYSDWYVNKASFLAVRNVNFGYRLSDDICQKIGIRNLRIYTSVTNPIVLTHPEFDGLNPEGFSLFDTDSATPGINRGSRPLNRTVTMGINITF